MHQHLSIVSKVSSQFILSTLNSEKLKIGETKTEKQTEREYTRLQVFVASFYGKI